MQFVFFLGGGTLATGFLKTALKCPISEYSQGFFTTDGSAYVLPRPPPS